MEGGGRTDGVRNWRGRKGGREGGRKGERREGLERSSSKDVYIGVPIDLAGK